MAQLIRNSINCIFTFDYYTSVSRRVSRGCNNTCEKGENFLKHFSQNLVADRRITLKRNLWLSEWIGFNPRIF